RRPDGEPRGRYRGLRSEGHGNRPQLPRLARPRERQRRPRRRQPRHPGSDRHALGLLQPRPGRRRARGLAAPADCRYRARPRRAIVNALDRGGVAPAAIETFTHGTTDSTNALIERTGAKMPFVTTKGFEDTPSIKRINRKVLYGLRWTKTEPLVASRRLCLGVDERLDADGIEVRAVEEEEVRELCRAIRDSGAEAVALCLLFSYVRTDHEERVKEI